MKNFISLKLKAIAFIALFGWHFSATAQYCTPGGTNTSYYINNFSTTDGIMNISNLNSGHAPGGYGDYTATDTVSQFNGEPVSFSADYNGGTFGTKIWVDWNQNGVFEASEIVYQTNAYESNESGTFNVPLSALPGATRMRVGISWTPSSGPDTPCESGSREFEDYTFVVIPLVDCSDADAGTIASTATQVCPDENFTITPSGYTTPGNGLTYQWQESTDGGTTWTDIAGANSINYTETGVNGTTDFRLKVTCDFGTLEDVSNEITITESPANTCYCTPPTPSNLSLYWIDDVSTTGAITDFSNLGTGMAVGAYADYTGTHTVETFPGGDFDLEIKSQNGASPGIKVWIDWNQDGLFDTDELIYDTNTGSSSTLNTYNINVQVPVNAVTGNTRMRIRNYTGQTPCNSLSYGETEDYNVIVAILADCNEADAGTIASTKTQVCPDENFTLTPTGYTEPGNGLTYQWQESTDGGTTWTDIAGANSLSYTGTGVTGTTDFRLKVTCDFGTLEDISNEITITESPANTCYCTPAGTNTSYYINNFSTTDGLMNISNLGSGHAPGGYGDYTATDTVSQFNGEPVSFSADYVGGTFGTKIWVDWNQDGVFDASEIVYQTNAYASNASGTFNVPTSALPGATRMRIGISYTPNSGPDTPCESGSREFEDYTFVVFPLNDCTEADAGTITSSVSQVCPDEDFTLTPSGYTTPGNGLTYQWQESTDGGTTWTDIAGANGINYTGTGVSGTTDFRLKVTCDFGTLEDVSNEITITQSPANTCYCTPPTPTYLDLYWINDVSTTGAITDFSNLGTGMAAGAYADYTGTHTVETFPGGDFDLEIKSQNGSSPGIKVWIDWNQDGVFDTDELIYDTNTGSSSSLNTYNINVQVPVNAVTGNTRMRIRNYTGQDPCNSLSYGETEDYNVMVTILPDCNDADAGTITSSASQVCPDENFTLTPTGYTEPGNGLTYQWQESTDGGTTWTDIAGANNLSYTGTGVNGTTDFRLKVTCDFGTLEDVSNEITITESPANTCYCTPAGTNTSYYINNFSTTDGLMNISNLGSGHAPGGYGDYTATHTVSQFNGEPVSFSADYVGGTFGTKIWVDWNQDGVFDANEIVYQTNGYANNASGTFNVPLSALPGATRMRIGISYTPDSGPDTPCESGSREFEDYTFVVIPLVDCSDADAGTITSSASQVCSDESFTITPSGYTTPGNGLTYQWQESTDGGTTWADIAGANSINYTGTGVNGTTDFRLKVTCDFGNLEDISNVVSIGETPSNQCYCIPAGTNSSYYIDNFSTTNGVINISNLNSGYSANGYGDFTATDTVSQYLELPIDFSTSFGASASNTFGTRIWVDWNQNGVFEANEVVFNSTAYLTSQTGSFIVPATAPLGATRMRVVNHYLSTTADVSPCATNHTYGEFEDYTLVVLPKPDCDTLTTPSNWAVLSDAEAVCISATSIELSIDNPIYASGVVYQYQYSTDGQQSWTNMGSNTIMNPHTDIDVRALWYCNGNPIDFTPIVHLPYVDPEVISVQDGEHCDEGSVQLSATVSSGTDAYWYDNANATGTEVYVGSPFMTPQLTSTTSYWVVAEEPTSQCKSVPVEVVATIQDYSGPTSGQSSTMNVCKNEPINLFNGLTGSNIDMNGEWYDYNWNLLSGPQQTAPNLQGAYNYYYVVDNGVCGVDTTHVEVIVDPSCNHISVAEHMLADISVHPNPATDKINIVNPSNTSSLSIELLDMNGRIVVAEEKVFKNATEATVSIDHLERGVYTLRVYNENNQRTFKIVKH